MSRPRRMHWVLEGSLKTACGRLLTGRDVHVTTDETAANCPDCKDAVRKWLSER